jgi:hypothetical protein
MVQADSTEHKMMPTVDVIKEYRLFKMYFEKQVVGGPVCQNRTR